jgi:hypothetical protein
LTTWSGEELSAIGDAGELRVASLRGDGSLRRRRTIWVVRHGDDLYVRSVREAEGAWFRGVQERHEGRISAGGLDRGVTFEDADHALDDEVDEEYRQKYGRTSTAVDRITSADARSTTIRLVPA